MEAYQMLILAFVAGLLMWATIMLFVGFSSGDWEDDDAWEDDE